MLFDTEMSMLVGTHSGTAPASDGTMRYCPKRTRDTVQFDNLRLCICVRGRTTAPVYTLEKTDHIFFFFLVMRRMQNQVSCRKYIQPVITRKAVETYHMIFISDFSLMLCYRRAEPLMLRSILFLFSSMVHAKI